MRGGRHIAAIFALFAVATLGAASVPAAQFQADDWHTECEGRSGNTCSITVPFESRSRAGVIGSFAFVVYVETGEMAMVGRPLPLAGTLRVDRNLPVGCVGPRFCAFADSGKGLLRQLASGSVLFIDIVTADGSYHASTSTKGYRAGIAKIGAWRLPESDPDAAGNFSGHLARR